VHQPDPPIAPHPGAGLDRLARPSGVFAMLALDQRESLRTMLEDARPGPAADADLVAFKVAAARILTPHASAVLLDVPFGLQPVTAADAIAPGCGRIVAADRLTQQPGAAVEDTDVDDEVLADDAIASVADAYKLLVIWRPDRDRGRRQDTVGRFVEGCRRRGRPSVVEGIVRAAEGSPPLDPAAHVDAVLEAAAELTEAGPDLYKAEVPTQGRLDDEAIVAGSRRLGAIVRRPWVVLSNGVTAERFPTAALAAARGGASGFLAGRAIWSESLRASDVEGDLATAAADRLRSLGEAMEGIARPWRAVVEEVQG
jgi:sulfofructosephosphate aldolase